MPRPKTQSDERVLAAAIAVMHERGPDALTFSALAERCGLSAATLVQRFGNKDNLKRSALLLAWDHLERETELLAHAVPQTPDGAVQLLVGLTAQYGEIEHYADGLLVLREDLRDPVLRARGAAWKATLCAALDACFLHDQGYPARIGLLVATHWQGALLWWSFKPEQRIDTYAEECLRGFIAALAWQRPASCATMTRS